MCYIRAPQDHRTLCRFVPCGICGLKIGLVCNSTDLTMYGVDMVICGVCKDIHTDMVIDEVLA